MLNFSLRTSDLLFSGLIKLEIEITLMPHKNYLFRKQTIQEKHGYLFQNSAKKSSVFDYLTESYKKFFILVLQRTMKEKGKVFEVIHA